MEDSPAFCTGVGVGAEIIGVADSEIAGSCSGNGVCEGVTVSVAVAVGEFSVTCAVCVSVGVPVDVTCTVASSCVAEGVCVGDVSVKVVVGVDVGDDEVGGADVSVAGGLSVGGGGLGVLVTGLDVGVRVGTVPCWSGIAHTTGSIENSVHKINSDTLTVLL